MIRFGTQFTSSWGCDYCGTRDNLHRFDYGHVTGLLCGECARATDNAPIITRDRYGTRAYVWPTGESICRDGHGRMSWTLYVGNEWTACYDSRGEALADYGLSL